MQNLLNQFKELRENHEKQMQKFLEMILRSQTKGPSASNSDRFEA